MKKELEPFYRRRSVRAYQDEPVAEELIDALLEAGQYAPTGKNSQQVALLAVQDKELRDTLSALNADVMRRQVPTYQADPFYGAPAVIAVLADTERPTHIHDGSCVMENLLLAASELGLGSCWIHRAKEVFETDEGKAIKARFDIPESYEGVGFAIIGHPAQEIPAASERKSIVRKAL